jgi:nitroreductase/NAD-dependent dihydropyrimidine dehydrogenase PreA subunit
MSIKGIDYDKCIDCGICLRACSRLETHYYRDVSQNKVIYRDLEKQCIKCGQCIAQCPEDAIIHEGIGESLTFEKIHDLPSLIPYETLFQFIAANRSVRIYKPQKIPREILENVIKAMNYAPTAANMRSENFYVVSDDTVISELSKRIRNALTSDPSLKDQFGAQFDSLSKYYKNPIYYDAPHVIFVGSSFNMMMEGFNIGIIITYARLAAQSLGLGTCWNGWSQLGIQVDPTIKKLIKLRGYVIVAFTIGYPAENLRYFRVPPREKEGIKWI